MRMTEIMTKAEKVRIIEKVEFVSGMWYILNRKAMKGFPTPFIPRSPAEPDEVGGWVRSPPTLRLRRIKYHGSQTVKYGR